MSRSAVLRVMLFASVVAALIGGPSLAGGAELRPCPQADAAYCPPPPCLASAADVVYPCPSPCPYDALAIECPFPPCDPGACEPPDPCTLLGTIACPPPCVLDSCDLPEPCDVIDPCDPCQIVVCTPEPPPVPCSPDPCEIPCQDLECVRGLVQKVCDKTRLCEFYCPMASYPCPPCLQLSFCYPCYAGAYYCPPPCYAIAIADVASSAMVCSPIPCPQYFACVQSEE